MLVTSSYNRGRLRENSYRFTKPSLDWVETIPTRLGLGFYRLLIYRDTHWNHDLSKLEVFTLQFFFIIKTRYPVRKYCDIK